MAHTTRNINLQTGGGSLSVTVRTDGATVIAGVKCYLFNISGSYLGQTMITDENGMVSFDVADGFYQVRVDYSGAQFWSDTVNVPEVLTTAVLIEHRDMELSVTRQWDEESAPLPGVKCYLFTESGTYTGINSITDESGKVNFSLPEQSYKVRADYLGGHYWSEPFIWNDSSIDIAHSELRLFLHENNTPVSDATVYLFSESGSYLGVNSKTDDAGEVSFVVPESSYKLRIDYNGGQYWSTVLNVLPGQQNDFDLDLTADALTFDPTNDPRPDRWDGEPPLYTPLLAMTAGSLTGMLGQITTQALVSDEARSFWYINDHLGTAQLITDNLGKVIWQGNYLPFGAVDVVVDQLNNRFRFPGQYFDSETGLHYNWHRFYDPETGRYISADPIGLAGGINLYGYVQNDPVNVIDPWGLTSCPDIKYHFISNCIDQYGDALDKCKSNCDDECEDKARNTFENCLENSHSKCSGDLNGDGKVDKYDEAIWFLTRRLWDLRTPPFTPYPPGFGDEGPGAIDPGNYRIPPQT